MPCSPLKYIGGRFGRFRCLRECCGGARQCGASRKTKFEILDFVKLGAIQFTLIFGANSAARETVRPSIAALADEIMLWLAKPLFAATVENKTIDPLFFFNLS